MKRCKIYQDEQFCGCGYVSSRDEYFYGLKVHVLMTESGIPAKIFFLPDYMLMSTFFMTFLFFVPSGSGIYGDKAYYAYNIEDEAQTVRYSSEPCLSERTIQKETMNHWKKTESR